MAGASHTVIKEMQEDAQAPSPPNGLKLLIKKIVSPGDGSRELALTGYLVSTEDGKWSPNLDMAEPGQAGRQIATMCARCPALGDGL